MTSSATKSVMAFIHNASSLIHVGEYVGHGVKHLGRRVAQLDEDYAAPNLSRRSYISLHCVMAGAAGAVVAPLALVSGSCAVAGILEFAALLESGAMVSAFAATTSPLVLGTAALVGAGAGSYYAYTYAEKRYTYIHEQIHARYIAGVISNLTGNLNDIRLQIVTVDLSQLQNWERNLERKRARYEEYPEVATLYQEVLASIRQRIQEINAALARSREEQNFLEELTPYQDLLAHLDGPDAALVLDADISRALVFLGKNEKRFRGFNDTILQKHRQLTEKLSTHLDMRYNA